MPNHSAAHRHSGPWSDSLPARTMADLAQPERSLDPSDQVWSQWRSAALIAQGPARSARFALEAVGPERQDVLEVGCGSGYLALELARAGHRVVAIDPGAEGLALGERTLAACREAGEAVTVDYHEADFVAWDDRGSRFDALVFNQSLHHIEELDRAFARAVRLLRPGGRIVVNDYAYDRFDERTVAWLADLEAVMGWAALAAKIAEAATRHVLHGFEPLITGLRAAFDQTHFSWEPYIFTRIANRAAALPAERHDRLVPFLYDLERLQIDAGAVNAVCYRFLGIRR